MLRIVNQIVRRTRKQCPHIPKVRASSRMVHRPIYEDKKISTSEKSKILSILNSQDISTMLSHNIALPDAEKIVQFVGQNGPYKDISDIRQMEADTSIQLDQFFKTVTAPTKRKQSLVSRRPAITPAVTKDMQESIGTVLGLHLRGGILTWAAVNQKMRLLEWNFTEYSPEQPPPSPISISNIISIAKILTKYVPVCDVYVTEEMKRGKLTEVDMKTGMKPQEEQQLLVAVMTILATRKSRTKEKCFVMRSNLSARHFDLLVGTEIVSTTPVIDSLLNDETEEEVPRLQITDHQKSSFYGQNPLIKQEMSWSLLKAITFFNVALCKDSRKSIL